MKIAVIGSKGLPPRQGGIEHYCAEVYPRMVAQGHQVDLFARSSWIHLPWYQSCRFHGVQVISLPCPGKRGLDGLISSSLGAIACLGKRYDIIHFHALGPSLFCWLPRMAASAKVVVSCHGLDWQREKWGNCSSCLIWLGEQVAIRCSDQIIVVSEALVDYFQDTYAVEAINIPNGPASYWQSDPTFSFVKLLGLEPQKYLLFLGRLVPEKCPDLLIQAFQRLTSTGWKLAIVGGQSDAPAYQMNLFKLAAANPNIIFAGELKERYLAEIVRGAGLFILPSNLEGLPLAMLEAMQEGIPVVASDIPPHRQLIGMNRGRLFHAGDLESCIQMIDWAIQHSKEMKKMAQKAQEHVQTWYGWDGITAATLRTYESLLCPPRSKVKPATELIQR